MKLVCEVDPATAIREMLASSPGLWRIFPTLTAPSFARALKRCWRILEGQVTQGFIMERNPGERFAKFGSTEVLIAVHLAYRRRGVATRALEQLLDKMDEAFVLVSPKNPAALELFLRMERLSRIDDIEQAPENWQDRMDSMDTSCPSSLGNVPPTKHRSETVVFSKS